MLKKLFNIKKASSVCVDDIKSYSQCGEDMILDFLINWIGLDTVRYLDLGANDPINYNNTYRFYLKGFNGVLVEADSEISEKIRRVRPNDVCLNKAVTTDPDGYISFYKMSSDTLSTTHGVTAERYIRESSQTLTEQRTVESININNLLKLYFAEVGLDVVSIDVEGLDSELLQSWDFDSCRPKIICIETLTYANMNKGEKIMSIFETMDKNKYFAYADTYINTIFIDKFVFDQCK